ncbi:glycosyltransferase [uncultured Sphingomonas sp.]|uniref:glycosyltransferase n=1 Tax=uncultured Sphingomonas sp. TaxID=158754 RepID=UPI0035C98498
MTLLALLPLTIWTYLLIAHSRFWLARERDTAVPHAPLTWPSVVAVVPARDEADVIARSIGSLAVQDYPGEFRIVLVDDGSTDGTGAIARSLGASQVSIVDGTPLHPGWTGKLWAVEQGIAAAGTPRYLWLTDADIAHAPDTLASLVSRAEAGNLVLTSLMAKLRCDTLAERALVPAFVFFFRLLYPFARVNRPTGIGAAAGGCMLIRADALAAAGGIGAVREALIDDCAVGALMKRQGRIWLGLTDRSVSIRRYDGWGPVAAMIARSAYAQLRYSPLLLAGTTLGLVITYLLAPALALFADGLARGVGLATWALIALSFQPMLRFYRRSPLWGIALPVIAAFYGGCTLLSALQHKRGRGGMWKGRAQAAMGR